MKDKLKPSKPIDDESGPILNRPESQLVQCPKCLSLFNLGFNHKCKIGWHVCSICGLDLHKKGKEILHNGIKYVTMPYKKSFNIMNKIICWECAFKIVKMFKKQ